MRTVWERAFPGGLHRRHHKVIWWKLELSIRIHQKLAWIHGTGMILTPILGALAYQQRSNGERVHGITSAHGTVGYITAGAYIVALLSVSF